jgi:hypothetical protein
MRIPLLNGRCLLLIFGLIALELSVVSPVWAQGANPELDALLQKGVEFPGGQFRKLRPPTLPDGFNAAAQQQAIEAVLAMRVGRPITYQEFTVKNLQTPNVLLIDGDPQYDANQPGHSINLWFVVYGKLKTVADPKFLKNQFKPGNTGRIDTLTADDLKQRQIVPRTIPNGTEWLVHGTFIMLQTDVRVQAQGTDRAVETTTKESAILAAQTDRRFDSDAKFPNDWRPVVQGVVQNQATLYYSSGGYAKVTQLVQPAGALLFEYHFIYDEPQAWFNGSNLLRPKLRTTTDGDVRTFRRDVKYAEK